MTQAEEYRRDIDYAESHLRLNAVDAAWVRRQAMENVKRLDFPCGCAYSTVTVSHGDGTREEAPVLYYCAAHRALKAEYMARRNAEYAPAWFGEGMARMYVAVRRAVCQATMMLAGRMP